MASNEFGVKISDAKLQSLIRTSPGKASNLVNAMALDGLGYVVRSFTVSVSAPGEAPGVVTGALKNSIHVESLGPYKKAIQTAVEYGAYLEFGTEYIQPRPFFAPMAAYLQRNVMNYWTTFVE